MVFWEGYVSDEVMSMYAPIVVFWLYAGFLELLPPLEKYRLHTKKEADAKNVVSLSTVIKGVLFQQFLQIVVLHSLYWITSNNVVVETKSQPSIPVQIFQFIIAMFVADTWQYFMHRYLHTNKFLYRHFHSQHHKMVVPYAIGALYGHPVEGLLMDIFCGTIAFVVSGMTTRTSVIFFCFMTVKSADIHSGLWFSGNPLQIFFESNSAYHDVHHQLGGVKYNYAQLFFTFWDKLLGTYMPHELTKRPDGGLEPRLLKD